MLDEYKIYFAIGAVAAGAIWAWIRLRKPARSTEMQQSSGAHSTNLQAGRDIESGDKSVNLQAGGDIVVGVTYDDARQIALDVYKANAVELAAAAKQAAIARAEELTDKFLGELKGKNPAAVSQAARPDFQIALLEAQKAYARTGDKDLAALLVDLLVNRTKQEPRSLREIVLAESLQVVPRLTVAQINTISAIFVLRYTENQLVTRLEDLGQWFDRYIAPLVSSLGKSDSLYRHLVYSGAATQELTSINLAAIFKTIYAGLWQCPIAC